MPGQGQRFQPGNPGRPKGAKNKFTSLKDSFLNVFQQMGGDEALLSWAQKNPGDFYGMVKTMLPKTVDSNLSGDISLTLAGLAQDLARWREEKK